MSPLLNIPNLLWPDPFPCKAERLENGCIHLWCTRLSDFTGNRSQLEGLLRPDERSQAARFYFSKDRHSFIIRRGLLRLLLSQYLSVPPDRIDFAYGQAGKPEVRGRDRKGHIQFNASHSAGLVLFAFTRDCPVGVDIEHVHWVPNLENIVTGFFSPHESETLLNLPRERREEAFFAVWTRKEALLKATGQGIGAGLAKVEVTLSPSARGIVRIGGESRTRTEWRLRSFSPAPGYIAAVAFKYRNLSLNKWRIPGFFAWAT